MKRPLQHFDIPFKGLHDGVHDMHFTVDDAFFSHFEKSIIDNGRFKVKLELIKKPGHSDLIFDVEGTCVHTCDRCLEPVSVPVSGSYTMYLQQGEDDTLDEDIITMEETASVVNVAAAIYEIVTVLQPLRKVHPEVDGKSCIDDELDRLDDGEADNTPSGDVWSSLDGLKFDN